MSLDVRKMIYLTAIGTYEPLPAHAFVYPATLTVRGLRR